MQLLRATREPKGMDCVVQNAFPKTVRHGQIRKNKEHLQRWRGFGRPSMKDRGGRWEVGIGESSLHKVEVGDPA